MAIQLKRSPASLWRWLASLPLGTAMAAQPALPNATGGALTGKRTVSLAGFGLFCGGGIVSARKKSSVRNPP